jgi:hypothetical protein
LRWSGSSLFAAGGADAVRWAGSAAAGTMTSSAGCASAVTAARKGAFGIKNAINDHAVKTKH